MSSSDPVGGYFELELKSSQLLPDGAIALNSGRSCFEYALRVLRPKLVYMPKFTCDVMLEPLKRLDIPHEFYPINDNLEISQSMELRPDELLVYTNYFGLKGDYSRHLAVQYGTQLILDCSQAFYFEPPQISHTFYSPRKFFGLPDGGYLFTDRRLEEELPVGVSYDRTSHLLKRIDLGAEAGYVDFKQNDQSLSGLPLERMSRLTTKLISSIDTASAKARREDNFKYLHKHIGAQNRIKLDLDNPHGPMVYPLLTPNTGLRQHLIENNVFAAMYWPNVLDWAEPSETEHQLAKLILALPVDQRYSEQEMARVARLVNEYQD